MCRVLFLYATGNSGHQKAAEAVGKSIRSQAPSFRTFGVDFFTCHYPRLGPFIFRMYLDLMQSMPHVWDSIYDNAEFAALTTEPRRFFNLINSPSCTGSSPGALPTLSSQLRPFPRDSSPPENRRATYRSPTLPL